MVIRLTILAQLLILTASCGSPENYTAGNSGAKAEEQIGVQVEVAPVEALRTALEDARRCQAGEQDDGMDNCAVFQSEGDSSAQILAAEHAAEQISLDSARAALMEVVKSFFAEEAPDLAIDSLVWELSNAADSLVALDNLAATGPDDDDDSRINARAFGRMGAVMKSQVTDLRSIRIGPDSESGAFMEIIVGLTPDRHIAGFYFGIFFS